MVNVAFPRGGAFELPEPVAPPVAPAAVKPPVERREAGTTAAVEIVGSTRGLMMLIPADWERVTLALADAVELIAASACAHPANDAAAATARRTARFIATAHTECGYGKLNDGEASSFPGNRFD